jgi:hypothetical protein
MTTSSFHWAKFPRDRLGTYEASMALLAYLSVENVHPNKVMTGMY